MAWYSTGSPAGVPVPYYPIVNYRGHLQLKFRPADQVEKTHVCFHEGDILGLKPSIANNVVKEAG